MKPPMSKVARPVGFSTGKIRPQVRRMMISSSTIHIANALTIEVSGLSLLTALKQMPSMSKPTMTDTSTDTHRASRSDS